MAILRYNDNGDWVTLLDTANIEKRLTRMEQVVDGLQTDTTALQTTVSKLQTTVTGLNTTVTADDAYVTYYLDSGIRCTRRGGSVILSFAEYGPVSCAAWAYVQMGTLPVGYRPASYYAYGAGMNRTGTKTCFIVIETDGGFGFRARGTAFSDDYVTGTTAFHIEG